MVAPLLGWEQGQTHRPRSRRPPEDFPDQIKAVPALSAAKEEALASIRKRKAMHAIEKAFGPASR